MIDTAPSQTLISKTTPFVTVMVPTLNEAKYIIVCLESIWLQDYPSDHCEVLIIDGGSTDGTREMAENFASERPNWRVLDNPGRTQSKAFNLGLRQSHGEIFVRMDAHAFYPADYLRLCVETLQHTGAANVGGTCNILPGGPGLIAASIAAVNKLPFGTGGSQHRVGGAEGPTDTIAFGAFPRAVFDLVGPMNERLRIGEDKELNTRLRIAGMTCYFQPDIVATYFARETLMGFLWQMHSHGRCLIPSLRINIRSCSLRHAIPAAFVLAILLLALAGCYSRPAWYVATILLTIHLLASVVVSVRVCLQHGWSYILVLPWLFLLTHLSYGIGSLHGIFSNGLCHLKNSDESIP